jgi:membrane-bound metal-dependent hydrolase YbcI (DUF457 family)
VSLAPFFASSLLLSLFFLCFLWQVLTLAFYGCFQAKLLVFLNQWLTRQSTRTLGDKAAQRL